MKWTGPVQFESPDGQLMMLPSDMTMIKDPEFAKYTQMYAADEELFFKDYAKAVTKLFELGVTFPQSGGGGGGGSDSSRALIAAGIIGFLAANSGK